MPSVIKKDDGRIKNRLIPIMELWAQSGQHHKIAMVGSSMLPYFMAGDQLCVSHENSDLNVGDVITFYKNNAHVAHRIIQIRDQSDRSTIITKGDNAKRVDAPLNPSEIIGRVSAVIRNEKSMNLDSFAWKILGRLIVYTTHIRLERKRMRHADIAAPVSALRLRFRQNLLRSFAFVVNRAIKALGPVACRFRPLKG